MHPKCGASLTTWVLLMFVMWMCTSAMAGFAEIPANVTVVLGTATPLCRCRHMTLDAHIYWRVNGSPNGQFPDIRSGSVNEDGTVVSTLTIPAEPQYNGTVVECVAFFFDGSPTEVSPPATIFFTPTDSLPETTHFETTPTNTPPGITEIPTNTPPDITENPTNTPPGTTNFMITPSPLTVAVEQGTATFQCQHPLAVAIGWMVNGKSLNKANLPNITTARSNNVTMLSIATLPEYNNATIECIAVFIDGSPPQFTTSVTLLIQGPLDPVSNVYLARGTSTLSWDPPLSLDLTGVDPDIAYCVDIYNITCGRRDLIVSDCNVTEPSYTSSAPDGYIYEYIITPRSNVEGARNGTPSQPFRDRFSRFSDSISKRDGVSTMNVQLAFLNLEPDRPVPSFYTVILESLDGLEDVILKTTSVTTEVNIIVVDVDHTLPLNRLWNCTLLAYGCRQNTILRDIELSTHDIQNISGSSRIPGQISVTGEFIQESMGTGVLVAVVNATYSKHHLISRDSRNGIDGVISGLPGGQYTVSVFVVSEDGPPFQRAATKPRRISVRNAAGPVGDRLSPAIEYRLDQTSAGVCITCTFLDNYPSTDCVAVVHQRISQLSSSGLMNIESSHKFIRSGETAYGCIEGVNLEQYQVGVIGGRRSIAMTHHTPSSPRSLYCIIGIVCAAVLVAVVLMGTTLSVLLYCIKRFHSNEGGRPSLGESEVDVEMKRCAAYQVVQLSRQRVTMKDNPAYVDVNIYTLP